MQKMRRLISYCLPWALLGHVSSSQEADECIARYSALPRRTSFFSRVRPPADIDPERFGHLLARGGIHPRGVVLDSEFWELPLRVDADLLAAEMASLVREAGWEGVDGGNAQQGVVSNHLRLVRCMHESLFSSHCARVR